MSRTVNALVATDMLLRAHVALSLVAIAATVLPAQTFNSQPAILTAQPRTLTTVHSFTGMCDGKYPLGGLVARGGVLYGTTSGSECLGVGPYNEPWGTVFSLTPPIVPGDSWVENVG